MHCHQCWHLGKILCLLMLDLKHWDASIKPIFVNLPIKGVRGCCSGQLVGVKSVGWLFFVNSRSLHPLLFVYLMPNLLIPKTSQEVSCVCMFCIESVQKKIISPYSFLRSTTFSNSPFHFWPSIISVAAQGNNKYIIDFKFFT